MKTFENYYEMEPGDTIVLKQKDGLELQVLVAEQGLVVKAPAHGTKLSVEKLQIYAHFIKSEET